MNTEEAPPELKSCPFCGSSKIVATGDDDGRYWKRCISCGATGPETSKYSGEEGDPYTDWNTRASSPAAEAKCVKCGHDRQFSSVPGTDGICCYHGSEIGTLCNCHCEFLDCFKTS